MSRHSAPSGFVRSSTSSARLCAFCAATRSASDRVPASSPANTRASFLSSETHASRSSASAGLSSSFGIFRSAPSRPSSARARNRRLRGSEAFRASSEIPSSSLSSSTAEEETAATLATACATPARVAKSQTPSASTSEESLSARRIARHAFVSANTASLLCSSCVACARHQAAALLASGGASASRRTSENVFRTVFSESAPPLVSSPNASARAHFASLFLAGSMFWCRVTRHAVLVRQASGVSARRFSASGSIEHARVNTSSLNRE
mmetsp:Transcript_15981/g.67355  ORF Transcript_15981/g.67355 Transcript_15981/m.67355 type:complete len:267 (+) Transcript_15981:961-1761(+)